MPRRVLIAAAAAAALVLGGCTLYDPRGRPPPGTNFNTDAAFGGSQRGYAVPRLRDQPSTWRRTAEDAGTPGLTRGQAAALMDGCAALFDVETPELAACEQGDLAFAQALETGCRAAHDGSDLVQCLAPLGR